MFPLSTVERLQIEHHFIQLQLKKGRQLVLRDSRHKSHPGRG